MTLWQIKDLDVLELHSKLKEIAEYVKGKMWGDRAEEISVITSAHREGDIGVHGTMPVRGLDLRCRSKQIAELIGREVNNLWTYDPERPEMMVCVVHGEGLNFHIHLQVHPNTVKKGGVYE